MTWTWDPEYQTWAIQGRDCWIWMNARQPYCDRGRWLAHLEVRDPLKVHVDGADGWPRYYFDLERAKLEIECWLIARRQTIEKLEPIEPAPNEKLEPY